MVSLAAFFIGFFHVDRTAKTGEFMADEATTPAATEAPDKSAQAAATPPADATGTNSGASDRTFTQADIDRIIKDRLDQERARGEKAAAKAKADAETAALAEQGKYKEIADRAMAELEAARAEARSASMRLLQRDVAAKTNLPAALADRLKGETAEEMEADAKSILAALPKPAAPNINANSGAGGAPAAGQLSDAEKRELAARLGVNPRFM